MNRQQSDDNPPPRSCIPPHEKLLEQVREGLCVAVRFLSSFITACGLLTTSQGLLLQLWQ